MQYGLQKERTLSILSGKLVGRDEKGNEVTIRITETPRRPKKVHTDNFQDWLVEQLRDGPVQRSVLTKRTFAKWHLSAKYMSEVLSQLIYAKKIRLEVRARSKGGWRYHRMNNFSDPSSK